MEQSAANLGASRWTVFRRITLPLMRPGLFAGGTIVPDGALGLQRNVSTARCFASDAGIEKSGP